MGLKDIFRSVPTVSAEEMRRTAGSSAEAPTLLDVRETAEYESGRIPGALHVPLSRLPDGVADVDPERSVVTYCKAGVRSRSAASILLGQGFQNVRSMEGGINAWRGLQAKGPYDQGLSLLTEGLIPEETLGLALVLEKGSGRFYREMSEILAGTDAGGTFEALAHAEAAHVKRIVGAAAGLGITSLPEDTGHGLMEGAADIEEALSWCREDGRTPFEILELAMQIEANSLDLYLKMLRLDNLIPVYGVLENIVAEEKAHLKSLGALLEKNV